MFIKTMDDVYINGDHVKTVYVSEEHSVFTVYISLGNGLSEIFYEFDTTADAEKCAYRLVKRIAGGSIHYDENKKCIDYYDPRNENQIEEQSPKEVLEQIGKVLGVEVQHNCGE